jgi:hypothetical protein
MNNGKRRRGRKSVKKFLRRMAAGGMPKSLQLSMAYERERAARAYWVVKRGQEDTRVVPNRAARRGNPTGRGGHR